MSPLTATIAWDDVDGFLQLMTREGPRLEYRRQWSAPANEAGPQKRPHARFADTVGAMANSGGGLIVFGVETDLQDRPIRWPTLEPSSLKPQTLEGEARNYLDPYVPLEIAIAEKRTADDSGDVVVVRVPSMNTPVFVDHRGLLVREGEATVPARLPTIREWLAAEARQAEASALELAQYISSSLRFDQPVLNIGAYPSADWHVSRWDDNSDADLSKVAGDLYPDLVHRTISDDLVDFRVSEDVNDIARWLWIKPSGSMLRRVEPSTDTQGRPDLLEIATEVRIAWEFAKSTASVTRPGYTGPISFGVAIGGIKQGFSTPRGVSVRIQDMPFTARNRREAWARWIELRPTATGDEVVIALLANMVRGFGYSGVAQQISVVGLMSAEQARNETRQSPL